MMKIINCYKWTNPLKPALKYSTTKKVDSAAFHIRCIDFLRSPLPTPLREPMSKKKKKTGSLCAECGSRTSDTFINKKKKQENIRTEKNRRERKKKLERLFLSFAHRSAAVALAYC